jgi:hypothetical protein
MSTFSNRRWVIIPATEVDNIDFSQVMESSPGSLRYSVDGSKTFIKYDIYVIEEDQTHTWINPETGEEQSSTTLAGIYGRPDFLDYDVVTEYNHSEILAILATEEWTAPRTEGEPI